MEIIEGRLETGGLKIAYDKTDGAGPTVIFLGGYASARKSVKGSALWGWARETGRSFIRFDYSGHGDSEGEFTDATLGSWLEESLAVIDEVSDPDKKLVLVGSSMGGWVALLAAMKRPERVGGLILIACGADFTEEVIRKILPPEALIELQNKGILWKPATDTSPATPITWKFMEEAKNHLLLGGPIPITCPVRLFHGLKDKDVPWKTSLKVLENLTSADATLELIKEGDHRLSTVADIGKLKETISRVCKG